MTVHVKEGKERISRHIYGHFSEHLGRCIYGGIWVGENSPIPNTRGIRNDIVKALREINIPNLRWPGGCFADEYHWKDGIGPREQRPKMINTHWGGVTEDNSFGTHEFMDLCEQLGCEPVICGNVGSGTVQEMSQWVEYLTSDNISPMTELRKQNGREKPWRVKFWGIGNETWGCGGNMRPEYYADVMRRYSTYCRNYGDNRLYKIACGPYDVNYEWTEVLMRDPATRRMMHGLSLHYYTVCHDWNNKGSATNFNESEWFLTMSKTLRMEEFITKHAAIMDKYDPEKRIGLIVDEWGNWHDVEPGTNPAFLYQQNTLRDALVAAINLNIFNNHCDRVRMANIAQTINVLQAMILTQDEKMVLTPSYYVFKMFKVHHEATLLPVTLQSENYVLESGGAIPALNASASRDALGRLHISVCNLNPNKSVQLECELSGADKIKSVSGEIITAERMNAYNDFGKTEAVNIQPFKKFTLKQNNLSIELPAKAIVMLELK
ncbi:MAG: alpha-N-arabinofuranosidase [candidate division KSB1 bacterium]|nr:alpha-N-arabinofuranosidase [candidate division KSB1 bacterium]MDZ7302377.1 alpha-N-arabinofuranosidase [candidate division KSB1 bacterium]